MVQKVLRIKKKYFFDICNNIKSLEARCGYPDLRKLTVKDKIEFQCQDKTCVKTLNDIRAYSTIEDMLKSEEISELLPDVSTYSEALRIYRSIYSPQKVQKNGGMLVFELN